MVYMSPHIQCLIWQCVSGKSETGKIEYDYTIFKWQIRDKINDDIIAETINITYSNANLPYILLLFNNPIINRYRINIFILR